MKSGALTRHRLDPNPPAVPLDDLLADRQADPRPSIFFDRVQALEDDEDTLEVFRCDADAVFADLKRPFGRRFLRRLAKPRRPFAAELPRVAQQILEQLTQLRALPDDC